MKILKEGEVQPEYPTYTGTCRICKAEIEFTRDDISLSNACYTDVYTDCPTERCGNLVLGEVKETT